MKELFTRDFTDFTDEHAATHSPISQMNAQRLIRALRVIHVQMQQSTATL